VFTQIETARILQFGANILDLAQQKSSRLRNTVMFEPGIRGKRFSRDQIGASEMVQRTTRNGDTQLLEVPHARRWMQPVPFTWATLIDGVDVRRVIEDPQSDYARAAASAAGRRIDRTIVEAFFATATTGEEAGSTVAFPAGQAINVNSWAYGTGTGNAGLTISKLIEAKVMLDAAEVGDEEERYIACTAKQLGNLLATTEVTSSDYNTVKALVKGEIDTYMGFKFNRVEFLPVDGNSYRRVPAYTRSGMCLGMVQDIEVRVDPRPDKNYSTQIWAQIDLGATRMEEVRVVEIKCAE
jgi:hypothetical protein